MDTYTAFLETKGHEISPEDENYTEELLEVADSFRSFGEALDEFLCAHGYEGDPKDADSKEAFLKSRFEKEKVLPLPRNMKKWFTGQSRPERSTAFAICFAFSLSAEETDEFFRRVCLARSFDCHDMREAICYYCIRKGHSFRKMQELISRSPAGKEGALTGGKVPFGKEVLYTGSIVRELERFRNEDELLCYLRENADHFRYNHATACQFIRLLWEKTAGENGLAAREQEQLQHRESGRTLQTVGKIYLQILGMDEVDEQGKALFAVKADRSLKPILKNNRLLPRMAEEDFPDRLSIGEILSGKHKSNEKVRKTLILLVFYKFWVSCALQKKEDSYRAGGGDADRCIDEINRYLLDAGYPALYYGNPFDWLFLFAAEDEYPLETFRGFLHELYISKEAFLRTAANPKENKEPVE